LKTVKKKLSGILAFVLLATMILPVAAFGAGGFNNDGTIGTNVNGSVYADVYYNEGVSISVYAPDGTFLGVTKAMYDSVTGGTYKYRYSTATGATYNWVNLLAYFGATDAVYKAVYKPSNNVFFGGGFASNNEINATNGTISASQVKDAVENGKVVKIADKLAIPADALAEAAKKAGAKLVISGDNGSIELPLSVLKLEELAKQLGVDLKDLKINISITKLSGAEATAVTDAAKTVGAAALSDAVDFAIVAEGKDGKKVAIDSFGSTYVKRTIKTNKAATKTATVALYNPASKALSFVPSVVADTYADFKRTGNSVYVVVENAASFNDVAGHWAKSDIELLASKLVVDGTGAGKFEADRAITRAEFAALAVKALGLNVASVVSNTYFSDVATSDWSAGYVAAAKTAGLVDGYEDGTFQGDKEITREELSALVVRALKFAGVDTSLTAAQQSAALAKFSDSDEIVWGEKEVAAAIHLGIVNGKTDTTLETASDATRAESATMLKRLLTKAGFIK